MHLAAKTARPVAFIPFDELKRTDFIARGGFGEVYKGEWTKMRFEIALKFIDVASE